MGQYSQVSRTPSPYLELGEDGEENENTLQNSFTAWRVEVEGGTGGDGEWGGAGRNEVKGRARV